MDHPDTASDQPAPVDPVDSRTPPLRVLTLTAFLSGAAVMMVELGGYRLLAPVCGASVYTWTALIGAVLIAFSAGSALGGWLADRGGRSRVLAGLLLAASVLVLVIPTIAGIIGPWIAHHTDVIVGPTIMALALFVAPGVLLGAVPPLAVRMVSQLSEDQHIGRSIGSIGMWSSLGSVAGTVGCGFVLMPTFGTRVLFLSIGLALALLGVLVALSARSWKPGPSNATAAALSIGAPLLAAIALLATEPAPPGRTLHVEQSAYHLLRVTEDDAGTRYLVLDSTIEGGVSPGREPLPFPVQQGWRLVADVPELAPSRVLVVGAGPYGMPIRIAQRWPQCRVDVVEIDPAVVRLGAEFFGTRDYPNIVSHADDARRFLQRQRDDVRWDLIFCDAYKGPRAVPPHLGTVEFFTLVRDHLAADGVLMVNVITALSGSRAEMLAAFTATCGQVFAHLEVVPTNPDAPESVQNAWLIGSAHPLAWLVEGGRPDADTIAETLRGGRLPADRWPGGGQILTDDFNPVDQMAARLLR